MKKLLNLFLIFLVSISASSQNSIDKVLGRYNSGQVAYVSVEGLKQMQDEEVLILDAREREEFEVSHIKNADFFSEKFLKGSLKNIQKETKIVVYCSIGVRSEKAGKKLQKAGFKNVWNLYGGIFEWKNSGFQVFDSEGRPTEKVHVYSEDWGEYLNNGEKIY